MKLYEKLLLILLLPVACLRRGASKMRKFTKRASRPAVAMLMALLVLISVMPISAVSWRQEHTHEGAAAISMGETFIMVNGIEMQSNRLPSGDYYLIEDISCTLEIDSDVKLCLNGHNITSKDYGIELYDHGEDDCNFALYDCGNGTVSGEYAGIRADIERGSVSVYGGTVRGRTGIRISGYSDTVASKLLLSGGSVLGTSYALSLRDTSCFLGGAFTLQAETADVSLDDSTLYAYGDDANEPYIGEAVSVEIGNFRHGLTVVDGLTDANRDSFIIANSDNLSDFSFVHEGNAIKIQGKEVNAAWFDEDGTTPLSDPALPTTLHFSEKFQLNDYPLPYKEGFVPLGWMNRNVGSSSWQNRYIYGYTTISNDVEFKPAYYEKIHSEGSGTAEDPILISSLEDFINIIDCIRNNIFYYNKPSTHYLLTSDIDLSSVCSAEQGNWQVPDAFRGQLDGGGHIVSGLYYDGKGDAGLFKTLSREASVKNLTVAGFIRAEYTGAVAAQEYGTVENCIDLVEVLPYGYTVEDNSQMAFMNKESKPTTVVIKSLYNNEWLQTSYSNNGFYIKTDGKGLTENDIIAFAEIINGGTYVKVTYTVTNNTDQPIEDEKLAVISDIQIGDNDNAAIEVIFDSEGNAIGFKMVDDHSEDKESCNSRLAQLNLYFAGAGGVTDADTHWMGWYSDRDKYYFQNISDETTGEHKENYKVDENGNYTQFFDRDSVLAFSWHNIDLEPGESREFSWVISVGSKTEPPVWDNTKISLSMSADAMETDRKINVSANIKDEAGNTDGLFYSVNGNDGLFLGSVTADGINTKNITGTIDITDWADGTYQFDFWAVNSKGAMSEKVRRVITLTDGVVSGDIVLLSPEKEHDWESNWTYDDASHWHNCRNDNCTVSDNSGKSGFGSHNFDSSCDTTCDICGYTRAITHTFNRKVMTSEYLASYTCGKPALYYYSCTCGAKGTTTFKGDIIDHNYVYSANGASVTETCTGTCGHTANATIAAPASSELIYDGSGKPVSVVYSDNWQGARDLTVTYNRNGNIIDAGEVTAEIKKGDSTASITYTIQKAILTSSDFIYTPPTDSTYTGSGKTAFVSARSGLSGIGNISVTYFAQNGEQLSQAPVNVGFYTIKINVGEGSNYKAAADLTDGAWSFIIKEKYAAPTIEFLETGFVYDGTEHKPEVVVKDGDTIIPSDEYTLIYHSNIQAGDGVVVVLDKPGGNYSVNGSATFPIATKELTVLWGNTDFTYNEKFVFPEFELQGILSGDVVCASTSGAEMEASKNAYTASITGIFGPDAHNYSLPKNTSTLFTIDKATPILGTVSVDGVVKDTTSPADVVLVRSNTHVPGTLEILDTAMLANKSSYSYIFTPTDTTNYKIVTGTVEIDVLDTVAPTATIKLSTNEWKKFFNNITFGLFFKDIQDVTVSFSDNENGSGIKDSLYFVADHELSETELSSVQWQNYNETLSLVPNGKYIIYAKAIDNDGNAVIVNSEKGIVIDTISPAIVGITNGESYYGDTAFKSLDENLYTVKVDGTDITALLSDGEYTIVADNALHTVTATDKAGNVTEYRITVYKKYNVSFMVGDTEILVESTGHGTDIVLPEPPAKMGYTVEWNSDGKNITSDTEIIAIYTANTYTVRFDNNGGDGTISDMAMTYDAAQNLIANSFTRTGYHFKGWNTKANLSGASYTDETSVKNLTAENGAVVTLFAEWEINEYTLTFMDENGEYKKLTYKHGDDVTMPEVPTKDGYTVKWDITIDKATGNAVIKAVYTENPKPIVPPTGDNSNIGLWIGLAAVSLGTFAIIVFIGFKKKKEREQN